MTTRSVASSPSAARRPSSPVSSSQSTAAASVARSLAIPHAEDVLSITNGSANDSTNNSSDQSKQQTKRRYEPTKNSTTTGTLFVILVAFLLSSITATMVISNHSYNFTPAPHWILVGSVTANSASFRVRNAKRLVVALDDPNIYDFEASALYDAVLNTTQLVTQGTLAAAYVYNLQPDTKYYYATFSTELSTTVLDSGSFLTAPDTYSVTGNEDARSTSSSLPPGGFKFAAAGCAWTGSASNVFEHIADEPDLLFMLHMGDFHYEDLDTSTNINDRIEAYDKVMASPTQRRLLNSVSLAYMYDDHDFLGNDSGADTSSPKARKSALQAYRLGIPHYPLASFARAATAVDPTEARAEAVQQGNYQAFTIGAVRFLMTDLRSESTNASIYSNEQRQWLYNELVQASNYDFVILISTKPWIGPVADYQDEDNWMGHAQDRRDLSNVIHNLLGSTTQNLLMIGSDAHMLAFDDGSNTYYGDASETHLDDNNGTNTIVTASSTTAEGVPSFPLLMTGPLDRLGSAKGGPFSNGCYAVDYERNHQYSIIEYQPPGSNEEGTACLMITGYSIDYFGSKTVVLEKQMCGQIFRPSKPGVGSCSGSILTENTQAVFGLALALLFTVVLLETCFLCDTWLHRFCLFSLVVVMFALTVMVGLVIPVTALGIDQFDTFAVAMIALFQIIVVACYLAWRLCKERCGKTNQRRKG